MGVNHRRQQLYGARVCERIAAVCAKAHLKTDVVVAEASPVSTSSVQLLASERVQSQVPKVTPAKDEVFHMLKDGKSVSEIAVERGVKETTVLGYLSDCVANGYAIATALV